MLGVNTMGIQPTTPSSDNALLYTLKEVNPQPLVVVLYLLTYKDKTPKLQSLVPCFMP